MKLSQQKIGFKGKIISFDLMPVLMRKKVLALGLVPNTEIQVIRFAPMGNPMHVRVRGTDLAISKNIAEHIIITHIDE